jgi:hypothetical protein
VSGRPRRASSSAPVDTARARRCACAGGHSNLLLTPVRRRVGREHGEALVGGGRRVARRQSRKGERCGHDDGTPGARHMCPRRLLCTGEWASRLARVRDLHMRGGAPRHVPPLLEFWEGAGLCLLRAVGAQPPAQINDPACTSAQEMLLSRKMKKKFVRGFLQPGGGVHPPNPSLG